MSKQLSEYAAIMTDSWSFMKKHFEPHDSVEYWEGLIRDADNVVKAHDSKDFTAALILLVIDDIEYRFKQQTGNPYRKSVIDEVYERIKKR